LRRYHKILWSKTLPNGDFFELVDTKPNTYLYHESDLGTFYLGSDAITHSYRNTKKMSHIIKQVPSEKVDTLFLHGSTIGAYVIFPSNKINNHITINGSRGFCRKIQDRFDLTLECIRLFYDNKESPLSAVFHRYGGLFDLFCDFKGYVDFFLLQDLVDTNYSSIKYHLQHRDFEGSPLPRNLNEYLEYRDNTIKFIRARGQRILASVNTYLARNQLQGYNSGL
jgi:hypothetical protein